MKCITPVRSSQCRRRWSVVCVKVAPTHQSVCGLVFVTVMLSAVLSVSGHVFLEG